MRDSSQLERQAVRRMADGRLRCPQCGGELLLVENGLLCVDGDCDEVYSIEDGKAVLFITEQGQNSDDSHRRGSIH